MDNENEAGDLIFVKQVLDGKKESFVPLVNRYKTPIFNLAFRMTGNKFDADDIAQEVFVKAYINLKSFRPEFRFFTWLYTIAINTAKNAIKRKRKISFIPIVRTAGEKEKITISEIPDEKSDSEELTIKNERKTEILRMLEILPEKYRTPFVLKYTENLTYKEISALIKIPAGTAKIRVYRARALLYSKFKNKI
jgi:RNA polymerase sigma-70 factor, ECF subfamily